MVVVWLFTQDGKQTKGNQILDRESLETLGEIKHTDVASVVLRVLAGILLIIFLPLGIAALATLILNPVSNRFALVPMIVSAGISYFAWLAMA